MESRGAEGGRESCSVGNVFLDLHLQRTFLSPHLFVTGDNGSDIFFVNFNVLYVA